jgi:hypothetical protein
MRTYEDILSDPNFRKTNKCSYYESRLVNKQYSSLIPFTDSTEKFEQLIYEGFDTPGEFSISCNYTYD